MTSQVLDPLGTNYTRLVVNRRAPCGALPNSNFPWIAEVSRLPRPGGGSRLWVSRNPLLWVSRNPQQAQTEFAHPERIAPTLFSLLEDLCVGLHVGVFDHLCAAGSSQVL